MGLFKGLFGKGETINKQKKELPWIPLSSLDQLIDVKERSHKKTQIIFKHSTTCGISRMVLNMFTDTYDLESEMVDLYFLDLHANRNVSNEVAIQFQVLHQSPQILAIKNGQTIFHASHGAITDIDPKQFL